MADADATVSHRIAIGDQSFNVRIRPQDRERYDDIAQYVAETLEDVSGVAVGSPAQALAMAAFQVAIELFDAQDELGSRRRDHDRDGERLRALVARIDAAVPRE